ncbi:MAG TPA: nucleotidyltransferase family protein [Opitutaceae bacterium]|jgi:CTP:molybdopterin cytidylyltransferase MocA|nr:nucleotidyltransferase family protein [Opitutaceae bacterium]
MQRTREPAWAGVILAAGASVRMGRPKQLLEVRGRPLVAGAAAAALEAGLWPVVVVLGAHADAIRPALARLPVLAVDNPAWSEGMASSIRAGIAALAAYSRSLPGAVLALCDQPALSGAALARLREAAAAGAGGVSAARYGGHLGAPAAFRAEHFGALKALTGDGGARPLLQAMGGRVAAIDLPELAADLDTPEDFARLRSE